MSAPGGIQQGLAPTEPGLLRPGACYTGRSTESGIEWWQHHADKWHVADAAAYRCGFPSQLMQGWWSYA